MLNLAVPSTQRTSAPTTTSGDVPGRGLAKQGVCVCVCVCEVSKCVEGVVRYVMSDADEGAAPERLPAARRLKDDETSKTD